MRIEEIEIKNYRLFRHARLKKLQPLSVFVGANGTGKSTLFDVFTFLKEALAQNVGTAVMRRGGFRELVSRGGEGPISIVVKFRESDERLATYRLDIAEVDGRPVVSREVLSKTRGDRGRPWHFLDFEGGKGKAIRNEAAAMKGAKEVPGSYALEEPSLLAIKGLGQFRDFPTAAAFRSLIENWHISDIHIADARPSAEAGYAQHLSSRGDNIAQVAQYLFDKHPETFSRVLDAMKSRVPGVSRVEAKPTEDGRLVLRFQDGAFQDPFISRYVSDGTIKMFAYLVLLHDPTPHPLLAIEEPENQLYPLLLRNLIEEFRSYAGRGGQVFVSTHSPEFLNGAELEEVYWLTKNDGFTTVHRASDTKLLRDLVAEGELPGALWKQGFFTGADPQ